VLGATSGASYAELRRNMALLLRWLHPDLDPKGERTVFTARVTRAWNDLKTQDRREVYDRSLRQSSSRTKERKSTRTQWNKRRPNRYSDHAKRNSGPVISLRHSEKKGLLHRVLSSLFARINL